MRSHGRIESAMWRDDDDWRALPVDAQWLYMTLISQSDLSLAGVLHLSRKRWSKFAADLGLVRLDTAIGTCSDRRFVVIDEDTEEALIRSFARRETQWSNSRRVGGLKSAVAMIQSPVILDALQAELARVNRATDGTKIDVGSTNRLEDVRPIVSTNALPETFDQSFGQSIAPSGSDVSRLPSVVDVDLGSSVTSRGPKPTKFKASMVDRTWHDYAIEHGFTPARTKRILEDFGDYWTAKSKDNTKLDWLATWRSWVRREADRNPPTTAAAWRDHA